MIDAVEENERLQRHVETAEATILRLIKERDAFQRGVIDAVAENERLKEAEQSFQHEAGRQCVLRKQAETDNERLRATLKSVYLLALTSNEIRPDCKQMREAGKLLASHEQRPGK